MKQITSPHNEIFKNLKQLATSAKHRRRTRQTLLEGVHLCEGYLEHVGQPQMVIYTDLAAENTEVVEIIEACDPGSRVLLGEANFKLISSVENGIGVAFVVDTPEFVAPESLKSSALLLEDVQDPGNLGAILRTAAAAGLREVFLSSDSASAWSPKVLRAGMGAHFALDIYENVDLESLIRKSLVPVLATSLEASEAIYDHDLSGESAWLFGNEGAGVSEKLLSLSTKRLIIPQNPKVESLNVAASVAVCLFEQLRQSGKHSEF